MSRFAGEHPEDYEDRIEAMRDAGDRTRTELREFSDGSYSIEAAEPESCACVARGYKACPLGRPMDACRLNADRKTV